MLEKHLDIPSADGNMNTLCPIAASGTPVRSNGFVFPQRTGIYNQAAAERHWERLFALFARTLGSARASSEMLTAS